MSLNSTERREARTSPMQIAHNPLFSVREKLELLNKMKAEVIGEAANPDKLAFDPDEIDAAIQEIELEVQDGERPLPSFVEDPYERRD